MCFPHQQKAGTDGYPTHPPENPWIKTQHGLDIVTESLGTYNPDETQRTHGQSQRPQGQRRPRALLHTLVGVRSP